MSADEWLAGDAGCDEYGYPISDIAPEPLPGSYAYLLKYGSVSSRDVIDSLRAEINRLQIALSIRDCTNVTLQASPATEPSTKPAPSHWARTLRQPAHQVIGLLVR